VACSPCAVLWPGGPVKGAFFVCACACLCRTGPGGRGLPWAPRGPPRHRPQSLVSAAAPRCGGRARGLGGPSLAWGVAACNIAKRACEWWRPFDGIGRSVGEADLTPGINLIPPQEGAGGPVVRRGTPGAASPGGPEQDRLMFEGAGGPVTYPGGGAAGGLFKGAWRQHRAIPGAQSLRQPRAIPGCQSHGLLRRQSRAILGAQSARQPRAIPGCQSRRQSQMASLGVRSLSRYPRQSRAILGVQSLRQPWATPGCQSHSSNHPRHLGVEVALVVLEDLPSRVVWLRVTLRNGRASGGDRLTG